MGNAPCYKCEDRTVGCHGSCERYEKYHKQRIQEAKRAEFASIIKDMEFDGRRRTQKERMHEKSKIKMRTER